MLFGPFIELSEPFIECISDVLSASDRAAGNRDVYGKPLVYVAYQNFIVKSCSFSYAQVQVTWKYINVCTY